VKKHTAPSNSVHSWAGTTRLALGLGLAVLAAQTAHAETCPFDNGNSSLAVEGVVLTRYALGITGAPLVANTGINAVDEPTVVAAINCPSCGLNITGNPTMTVADATIISRKLAGFSGPALTNGIALGSGTRNTPAAVQSFLLAGCGAAGANAFVNGGNAFGVPAVLGTTDGQPLTVGIGGAGGLRIVPTTGDYTNAPIIINGSSSNIANAQGATVSGGGSASPSGSAANQATGQFATVGGGFANRASTEGGTVAGGGLNKAMSNYSTVSGGYGNTASGVASVIGGGSQHNATGINSTVSGGTSNTASSQDSTVAGGRANAATGNKSAVLGGEDNQASGDLSTVGGGQNNSATGNYSTVAGGYQNTASGISSIVLGGALNTASGGNSLAAGRNAIAGGQGTFVWNSYNTPNNLQARTYSFRVQAENGFDVNYGANKQYYVAFNADNPGFIINTSTGIGMSTAGVWTNQSDRAKKREFAPINARDVLRKVVALPLSTWSYLAEESNIRHMGPMAQDFWKAFGLGYGDKTMNDVDSRGVAFAAIQGLNQKLIEQGKEKDARIELLTARLKAIEKKLGL
jgi:trimeric autotransporter adhesin